jgi:phosphoglycerate dehydrogenase-like enzyme
MYDGAMLVNVARGPVADTDAILAEAGRLSFALDVTDPEPLPPEHPLWRAPGVLISPHVGGNTSAFLPRIGRLVREQIERWESGSELLNVIVS